MGGIMLKLAIVGVGNCASSLVQGIYYYKNKSEKAITGLMHYDIGGYKPWDIKVVAAFDIDERKVGKDISEAIYQKPNCTTIFYDNVPYQNVKVEPSPILDGYPLLMEDYPEDIRFVPKKELENTLLTPDEQNYYLEREKKEGKLAIDILLEEKEDIKKEFERIVNILKETQAEVLINYLPVGSEIATQFYAKACLEAKVAFVNCIPVFIVSNKLWAEKFEKEGIPCVGDDIKSQVGATITHRVLAQLMKDRGAKLERTYQVNFGGNTDFLNMLERKRLKTKKVSKTEAVQSILGEPLDWKNIHIGPSDYIPFLKDNKIAYIRLEGKLFGDVPMYIELKLSVEDSPNSAGSAIDAIRCAKLGLDRNIGGPLYSISSYTMKHPPIQYPDWQAKELVEKFINNEIPR